jgi:hypothetical protein
LTYGEKLTRSAEIFGTAIVALGAFNPGIFSADWLQKNNLLGPQDADEARQSDSYVVSSKISNMETEWFSLRILENQLTLSSKGAVTLAVRDLAMGILSLLPHTPITALGLNFMGHYKMASAAEYHKIGDVFVPKDTWYELFPLEEYSVGMTDLSVRVYPTPYRESPTSENSINISVQPSARVKYGVFLSFNDHHEIKVDDGENETTAETTVQIIENEWQAIWDKATAMFDSLITKGLETELSRDWSEK